MLNEKLAAAWQAERRELKFSTNPLRKLRADLRDQGMTLESFLQLCYDCDYVLVERFGSTQESDYRVTLFSAPKKEQKEQLEKLIRSIRNGANGSNIELYPLH